MLFQIRPILFLKMQYNKKQNKYIINLYYIYLSQKKKKNFFLITIYYNINNKSKFAIIILIDINTTIGNYILRKPIKNIKAKKSDSDFTFINNLIILNKQTQSNKYLQLLLIGKKHKF